MVKTKASLPYTWLKRLIISIVVWGACIPVLLIYGPMSIGVTIQSFQQGFNAENDLMTTLFQLTFISGAFAWLLLLVMNIAWIKQYQLNSFIPKLGSICGFIGIAPFLLMGVITFLALPGVIFAFYLLYWHTQDKQPAELET